jgi:hypothetical protein
MATRLQIRKDGSIQLPQEILDALEAGPGSYLSVTATGGRAELIKIAYDPWTEGQKKTRPDSFDDLLKRQKEGLAEAEKDFMEKLKKPPAVKPEDRRDFWD